MMLELFTAILIAVGVLAFLLLLAFSAWVGFWDQYDDFLEQSKRSANAEQDACGFRVPRTMRDCK